MYKSVILNAEGKDRGELASYVAKKIKELGIKKPMVSFLSDGYEVVIIYKKKEN